MSEPVKIIVTAETAQAAADLARFVSQAGSGLKSLTPAAAESGEALQKMRESSMLLREGMHGLELGAMTLAGTKLPALAEAIMGLRLAINGTRTGAMLFGVGISEMLLPLAGLAAALGGGYLLWEGYGNHMEDAETKAKNLAAALEKLPEILKQISAAQAGGLVAAEQAKKWQDMLSGATPLYRNSGALGGEDLSTDRDIRNSRTGGIIGQREAASQDEKQKFVEHQILLAGLNKTQSDAAQQLKEIHDQDAAESLAGVQKKIALENERFQKELEHIRELHDITIAEGGKDNSDAAQAALARHNRAVDDINEKAALEKLTAEKKAQSELDKLGLEWQKQAEEYLRKMVAETRALSEEDKKRLADAEKLAQLQSEKDRSDAAVKLKEIQVNPFLTDIQKQQSAIPVIQDLMAANVKDIGSQANIADSSGTDSAGQIARQQALTKINGLMLQQVELQHQLDQAENANSFTYQLGEVIVKLQNVGTEAQQAAQVFASVWTTATDSMTKNFSEVIERHTSGGQALRSIYKSVIDDFIQGMVHMVVQWIMQHVIMQAISTGFHAITTALHITAETVKTTATVAGATTRVGANAAEAGSGAAASQAGIPFAGPVLAIAAMVAVFAAVMALSKGFAEGGYTGAGGKYDVRGVVHAGEYVMPASAVDRIGVDTLMALHHGGSAPAAASPAAGGGQGGIHNAVYFDMGKMIDALHRSDAHEKYVVDVMSQNIHKFR